MAMTPEWDVSVPSVTSPLTGGVLKPQRSSGKGLGEKVPLAGRGIASGIGDGLVLSKRAFKFSFFL